MSNKHRAKSKEISIEIKLKGFFDKLYIESQFGNIKNFQKRKTTIQRRIGCLNSGHKLTFPPPMSTKIILDNIITSSAPALFTDQISFQVTFTVLQPLVSPLAWKIIYVGSAYSEDYDQTLEEFQIDPIDTCGTMKFDIACNPPDATKIPRKQLLCVTALLLTASYQGQQFIRVGYYVHNQLLTQIQQNVNLDELPLSQLIKKIKRTIISDKPRVTKFNIQWAKKLPHNEQSQSKLSDYFSGSLKSHISSHENQIESSSQKMGMKQYNQNQKLSTQEQNQNENQNQIMIGE